MAVKTAPGSGAWGLGSGVWARPRELPKPETLDPRPAATRPRELRNTVALLFAILLISVISLLYMNQAGQLATSGYQISQLQQQRDQLQRDNQALEVELSNLNALPRIEDEATTKLLMTKGDLARVQYVNLDSKQLEAASHS